MNKLTLTNSSKNTFSDCQVKYFCEYILRLTSPEEPEYFTWGHMVHRMGECCDTGLVPAEAYLETCKLYTEEIERGLYTSKQQHFIDLRLNVLENMFTGHQLLHLSHDLQFEPLGAETKFSIPLEVETKGWEVFFMGKIDGFRREIASGLTYIWERKTAAQVNEYYWESKKLDSQPKGYVLGSHRGLGIRPMSVWYDVFVKPGIRQRKNETEEEYMQRLSEEYLLNRTRYFQRREIGPYTQAEIDAYYWQLCQKADEIIWHIEQGIWLPHHPSNRIGGCAYYPLCLNGMPGKINNRLLKRYIMRPPEAQHPELYEAEINGHN